MAEEISKVDKKKDETSGIGGIETLIGVGLGAAALFPFFKSFRNTSKIKSALETIESQAGQKTARVVAEEGQVMPVIAKKSGEVTKVNYAVQPKTNIAEPLLNDRDPRTNPAFGSASYDMIKISPKNEMKAEEWLDYFKSKQSAKYNDGRSSSIQMDELTDSNIVQFDNYGNLSGGLLAAAKTINAPINKDTLLKYISNNPINKLQIAEFKNPTKELSIYADDVEKNIERVADMMKKYGAPDDYSLITNLRYLNNKFKRKAEEGGVRSAKSNIDDIRDAIKNIKNGDLIKDPQDKRLIDDVFSTINKTQEQVGKLMNNPYNAQQLDKYPTYRMFGEENAKEIVWYYPEKIPGNIIGAAHFKIPNPKEPTTELSVQPLVHSMYGTRYNPKGEKVISINEIQADVQQKVFDDVKNIGKKRINPFNTENITPLLVTPKKEIQERINELLKKGVYTSDAELVELQSLIARGKTINRKLLESDTSNKSRQDVTDFLPMFDTKQYTDFALKTIIKKSAEDGPHQWVSVVPVNLITRANGAVPGNELVYGYANGKGVGKQGESIAAELMRKLAKQYNSEVKTMQVSKSNPNKPYKILENIEVNRYDRARDPTGRVPQKLLETFKNTHHKAAFATDEAAKDYVERNGGKIVYIDKDNPELYDLMFALKIVPDMLNKPMKLYKHEGGLIEDIFKTPLY
jgi:hypothetical protein